MNILVDIRPLLDNYKTGVGEYTYELLKNLLKIDNKNQYFLFYISWQKKIKFDFNLPVNAKLIRVKYPSRLINFLILFRLVKLDVFLSKITKQKFDIFLAFNSNFINLSDKINFIFTVHDLSFILFKKFFDFKRRLWHRLINFKRILKRADSVICVSESTKRDLLNYLPELHTKNLYILKPGLKSIYFNFKTKTKDVEQIRLKYNLPKNYILFISTLEPRKNLSTLIKIIQQTKATYLNYYLVICGAIGWQAKKNLFKIDNNKKVIYIGYINEKDKLLILKMAKLLIYPSYYEGFGLPIIESLAVGTPCLVSSNSSLIELDNDENIYYFSAHHSQELKFWLNYLINKNKVKLISQNKINNLKQKYNWFLTAKHLFKIIEEYACSD